MKFPGLKIFTQGISNISQFAANEYRQMMKIIVHVVAGVFTCKLPGFPGGTCHTHAGTYRGMF
jgi:hypothetical protein